MRVLVLGIGDAFSAQYYSCCLAVEADSQWLLIDCPHPIRKMLREASQKAGLEIDLQDLSGMYLTHLHADHVSGLEGFGFFSYFALQRRLKVISHKHVKRDLWDSCLAAGMKQLVLNGKRNDMTFESYFDWHEIHESKPLEFGPFTIECRKTIHHIPTTAVRIHAGGKTLAYSSDTDYDESLIEWLSVGDLVIHETNFGTHTPYEKLATLPADLRQKMRLIHATDEFDRNSSVIQYLAEGDLINL